MTIVQVQVHIWSEYDTDMLICDTTFDPLSDPSAIIFSWDLKLLQKLKMTMKVF